MMKLPKFEFLAPVSVKETVALLKKHGPQAKLLAGGTDLIVSMKQKLFEPKYIIGISRIAELQHIDFNPDDGLTLGAGATWDKVVQHASIRKHYPALAQAAEVVATPTLQNKGTVGGNICLDTRCWYYNQSYFWRKSLGWCMKKGSDYCHVAPGLGKCVAVFSSDPVPAMIAYDAKVTIVGPKGRRTQALEDLYQDDGIHFLKLATNEMVVKVQLPRPARNSRSTHIKFRKRQSIDYPIANACVQLQLDRKNIVKDIRIVMGAVESCPLRARAAEDSLRGMELTSQRIEDAAQLAFKDAKPMPNTAGTPLYRKKVARVLVKRALTQLSHSSK